jgi:hypothetical protein
LGFPIFFAKLWDVGLDGNYLYFGSFWSRFCDASLDVLMRDIELFSGSFAIRVELEISTSMQSSIFNLQNPSLNPHQNKTLH